MTYKDLATDMQKFAAAQRKQFVMDKLASIIPNAVKARDEKLQAKAQRRADVQVKVASIIKKVTQPEQHKADVQVKVASILEKARKARKA